MAEQHIVGCILGTAVGDAIGLPYEGISRNRVNKLIGEHLKHRLVFGYGMISDDTEHTVMVAQSLLEANRDTEIFQARLAKRLRYWFLALPAGIGFATLRAIIRLWLGFQPKNSGVYSAGNGPAMRSAILGTAITDLEQLKLFVKASTLITHTDPKAEYGALAVALAAFYVSNNSRCTAEGYFQLLNEHLPVEAKELFLLIKNAISSVKNRETTQEFAVSLSLSKGVTGYIYHTVPVAIHAWLSHSGNFEAAVTSVVRCGGDTDTVAAIVGGIVGAAVGKAGIPEKWLDGICDWPISINKIEEVAGQLSSKKESSKPAKISFFFSMLRNIVFMMVILVHGLRRLLPPY
ncbi:ADP-ribosylglycohydrolase family protein [Spartinivicinus poritis]|uniref:ADP-ribosylglycohydrolase family protein n=1 Tax=Spartinivicinus poritis TaxID=2994640 RepID=A0ABT5UFI4_9GAMM|nr:ADP-ribosylglycohydrolase family protein [Spartinivicinus sp. A2-2]MDE1465139.1 ADP-ribosylglycohydrolase family protein [Spartinivicinus sp. A2-2]